MYIKRLVLNESFFCWQKIPFSSKWVKSNYIKKWYNTIKIIKFDINNNIIEKYNWVREAARKNWVSATSILKSCNWYIKNCKWFVYKKY